MSETKMNPAQQEAVEHKDGAALVLAGPGSGKTFVITHRIQYLIDHYHISPSNILVITFTKAAALQMQERFMQLSQGRGAAVTFGTFHSIFFRILKYAYNYNASNIAREDQRLVLVRELVHAEQIESEDENELVQGILAEISALKNERLELEHYHAKACGDSQFQSIYQKYEQRMRAANLVDFDDMLLMTWELLSARADILKQWQDKYQYILIDEFQDVNRVQYDTIRLLAEPRRNLFIVGDDDQSIYRFRGSKPEIMLGFEKEYPECKRILLNINYRCNANVVRAAVNVIDHNKIRFEKEIAAFKEKGNKVLVTACADEREECTRILNRIRMAHKAGECWSDHAVLVRTNTGARFLVEKLIEYNLPFHAKDRIPNLFEHWIARQLFCYLRMAHGDCSRETYLQVINKPNRYISREALSERVVSLEGLKAYYADKDWLVERIDKLQYDLKMMGKMTPYAAINYIRHGMGYEKYLEDYGKQHKISSEELIDILEQLHDSSKEFKTLEDWFVHIQEFSEQLRQQMQKKQIQEDAIHICTMHSSKGLEYKNVYLLDVNEEITPHQKAVLEQDIEEERRLFYVAMTRAKDNLYIYYVKERLGKSMKPSRFIEEMLERRVKNKQEKKTIPKQ
ncbi:MAG: ATP-dependent helicase [Lachnospiraceae bacterium]